MKDLSPWQIAPMSKIFDMGRYSGSSWRVSNIFYNFMKKPYCMRDSKSTECGCEKCQCAYGRGSADLIPRCRSSSELSSILATVRLMQNASERFVRWRRNSVALPQVLLNDLNCNRPVRECQVLFGFISITCCNHIRVTSELG